MTDVDKGDDTNAREAFAGEALRQIPLTNYVAARGPRSLAVLVDVIERIDSDEAGLSVSLLVHGAIVTGELISSRRYYVLFSEQLQEALGTEAQLPENRDAFATITRMGILPDGEHERRDRLREETGTDEMFGWLSLNNAQTYQGDALVPTVSGPLMRVRVAAVDGFSLGRIKQIRVP